MSGLRALSGIADLPVRIGAAGVRANGDAPRFVAELEGLVRDAARSGSVAEADAVLACVLWMLGAGDAQLDALHRRAKDGDHAILATALADGEAHKHLARGGRLAELGIAEAARPRRAVLGRVWYCDPGPEPTTLDEYEAYFERIAATAHVGEAALHPLNRRDRVREVTRFLRHPSPFTIGRLLDDPWVRPKDAVAIAARRPTTPALVAELTKRPRWMAHPEVRAAVARNPYSPPRVGALLALTVLPHLRAVRAGNVHPRLRELDRLLG